MHDGRVLGFHVSLVNTHDSNEGAEETDEERPFFDLPSETAEFKGIINKGKYQLLSELTEASLPEESSIW